VFDLDPSEKQPEILSAAAIALRDLLSELGLQSWVKTSGSKGFHIVVPLDGSADYGDVGRFANAAGTLLVRSDPKHLTQEFSKADRGGRILVDTGRYAYHATFATPYSVRAKQGAPVSAPCTWDEIKNGTGPRSFLLRGMADRLWTVGDLWSEMLMRGQALTPAIERLQRLQGMKSRSVPIANLELDENIGFAYPSSASAFDVQHASRAGSRCVSATFKSRAALPLENLALRHQLGVLPALREVA
jgi:DNA primase